MALAIPPFRAHFQRITPFGRAAIGASLALAGVVALVGPARLIAQIEGDRGIAPVVSTGDIETGGIEVDVTGKTAAEARQTGWREAYKKAWEQLHGPAMDVGTIESLVSGVVIEREQIGPHRYIAKLGVVFDRSRAGQYVGDGASLGIRSAPLLTVPVLYSGGVAQVYEVRTEWQRVWAEFRTGESAIDYVRPSGAGGDSLLITAGQAGRRSRIWWRNVLDQYAASDVLFPIARLERQWPGGPVKGTFTARYGPDNEFLGSVTFTAADDDGVPAMMQKGLKALDGIFTDALHRGLLTTDPTLSIDHPQIDPALQALIAKGRAQQDQAAQTAAQANAAEAAALNTPRIDPVPVASEEPAAKPKPAAAGITIQFASPDARAVDQALAAVRGASGVTGASTVSLAIGGTSVMRASYAGSAAELATVLRARGWKATVTGSTLRISR